MWICDYERKDKMASDIPVNFLVAGRNPHYDSLKTWEETIKEDRMASKITHINPTDRIS